MPILPVALLNQNVHMTGYKVSVAYSKSISTRIKSP